MAQPAARGRQLQLNLATLRRMHPTVALRLEHTMGAQLASIDRANAIDWLDFEIAVRYFESVSHELGAEGFHRYNVQSMQDALAGPLLSSLWTGSLRVFGQQPRSLLRWAPQLWSLIYRDVAQIEWDAELERLRLRSVCAAAYQSMPFLETVAAAVDGVFALCRQSSRTAVDPVSRDCVWITPPSRRSL